MIIHKTSDRLTEHKFIFCECIAAVIAWLIACLHTVICIYKSKLNFRFQLRKSIALYLYIKLRFLEIRCLSIPTYRDDNFVWENIPPLILLIIFPERTTDQQFHINSYTTYLYNNRRGHIPQVRDQSHVSLKNNQNFLRDNGKDNSWITQDWLIHFALQ